MGPQAVTEAVVPFALEWWEDTGWGGCLLQHRDLG